MRSLFPPEKVVHVAARYKEKIKAKASSQWGICVLCGELEVTGGPGRSSPGRRGLNAGSRDSTVIWQSRAETRHLKPRDHTIPHSAEPCPVSRPASGSFCQDAKINSLETAVERLREKAARCARVVI